MKHLMILFVMIFSISVFAQPSAEIIKKVDKNLITDNQIATSKMIINGRRGSRTVEAKSWQRGVDDSFTEELAPAR